MLLGVKLMVAIPCFFITGSLIVIPDYLHVTVEAVFSQLLGRWGIATGVIYNMTN